MNRPSAITLSMMLGKQPPPKITVMPSIIHLVEEQRPKELPPVCIISRATRGSATRLDVWNLLKQEPMTSAEAAARLGISHNAADKHMINLRLAGRIEVVRTSKTTGRGANVYAVKGEWK